MVRDRIHGMDLIEKNRTGRIKPIPSTSVSINYNYCYKLGYNRVKSKN